MQLSTLQTRFINNFQGNFPLQNRPFKIIAEQFNCDEETLITAVKELQCENILTRFGPLYDAAQLGGGLTLAAMKVPEDKYAVVTDIVNSYPEVAHNYRREHELNMWFVIATGTPVELVQIISSIEKTTGIDVYNFPKQQEFYIGLWLHLSKSGQISTTSLPLTADKKTVDTTSAVNTLDAIDKKLIQATQTGLAIERTPYQRIAKTLDISQHEVLHRLQAMLSRRIIRRIGAIPNHYRLGLSANGMTVWDIDDNKISALGKVISQLDFVSHCYQRPRHLPMWSYNLFAMVHGENKEEVHEKTKQIEALLEKSCHAHETLFSTAILKKTGLRLAS